LAAGAGLATAPVLVWHFERLSIAGLAVNVIAVPLAAPVVIVALIGIPAAALHPVAGEACAFAAGLGAEGILVMARLSTRVPNAAVDLPRAVAPALVVLPVLPHLARRVLPALSAAGRRGVGGVGAALVGAALVFGGSPPEPWPATPELRVLDVGQGNAALLRSPRGETALIDTGPPGTPVPLAERLDGLGVGRVDLLVLSHGSLDHVGGLESLLRRAAPRVAALGPEIPPEQHTRLARRFRSVGTRVTVVSRGSALRSGNWRVSAVSPEGRDYRGGDPNPRSLVLLAAAGGARALITSDAESSALAATPLLRVDLLAVAHHGSRDSGLADLLRRVRPSAAAISVGEGNAFGHPTPETLETLAAAGVPIRRTDLDGDVWLRADAEGVRFGSG
jgi:competence protein ComEC